MDTAAPSSFRLIASMVVAGAASGLVLVSIYLGTLPMIERNRARALERAVLNVLPGATSFKPLVLQEGALIEPGERPVPPEEGQTVYRGFDDQGRSTGVAIPAEGAGYADTVKVIYGLDPRQGTVVGLEVLESRETPGLGDKIIYDEAWLRNFEALQVKPEITLVKQGEKTSPHQVEGISGATISSKAVVRMLQDSVEKWYPLLAPPAEDHASVKEP